MSSIRNFARTLRLAMGLALCVAAFAPRFALAQTEGWIVTEATGETARQAANSGWVALKPGDNVSEGASVRTGSDGRLVLTRSSHKDTITIAPGSQFTIAPGAATETGPTILQALGTVLFKVEHTPGRHFEVTTPYLTAVVKGTVFTVTIGHDENTVSLANGSVEVASRNTREVALLRPGQTARVPTTSGRPMTVIGALAPGAAESPKGEAKADDGGQKLTHTLGEVQLDVAALSNNLVGPNGSAGTSQNPNGASSAEPVIGAVSNLVNNGTGAGGNAANGAAGGVAGAVDGAAGLAGGIVNGASNTAGNLIGTVDGAVGNTVTSVSNTLGNTVSNVGSAVGGAVSSLGTTVSGTLGSTGGTVGGTVGSVGSAVGSTASTVGSTVAATGSTVSGAVTGVTNTAGSLLGGNKSKLKLP